MKKKQVLAVSSALMIGTTTALTGLPTPVMAQYYQAHYNKLIFHL